MTAATAPQSRRDLPLDALRGLAIFGMVLANLQGDEKAAFPLLAHAAWDGLTIADLVFPMFLLAVGLALPLAQDGREPPVPIGRIVRRAVLLWLIGFSIGMIVHPSLHLADVRFTGVLERIGIVYLICALTMRATRGWQVPAMIAAALLVLHGALLLSPAPDSGIASMAPGAGMSGWLDRAILGGTRMYGKIFDPEGPLSTLSSIATALIGVSVQRMAMRSPRPVFVIAGAALVFAAVTLVAAHVWPINKALWTPSFALANAAIGLGLLALLKLVWPAIGSFGPAALTARLGQIALTLYVVHSVVTIVLILVPAGEGSLYGATFAALLRLSLPPDWTSLLFALIFGGLSVAISLWLARRGWVLRV